MGDEMEFRRLAGPDLAMVNEWVRRPHVAAAWNGAIELETGIGQSVALLGGAPIGYIQSYRAIDGHREGWWLEEHDPGVFGIDQFVADGARLSRGLGTRMVRAFVARLFEDPRITRVQADPRPSNLGAIRCYEKCGLVRVREIVTPDGPALLLARSR